MKKSKKERRTVTAEGLNNNKSGNSKNFSPELNGASRIGKDVTLSDNYEDRVKQHLTTEGGLETIQNFMERIWNYTSIDAKCYSVVWINQSGGINYKIYCLKPLLKEDVKNNRVELVQDYDELYTKASALVKDLSKDKNLHVYYQVLPLSKIPQRGRGSVDDVSVGKWLWADIDYKEVVENAEFEGCKELKDFALKCFYKEGDKIIKVERPQLNNLLSILRNSGLEPSLIVDSGAGYHLYWQLDTEIDAKELKTLEDKLVDFLINKGISVDEKAKDLARILRLPGTVNPRTNRVVHIIHESEKVYSTEELKEILKTEEPKSTKGENVTEDGLTVLDDAKLIEIKEQLKDAYRPGYRQFLILYLAGWLAQAKVHPLSAIKLAKMLYESSKDEDPLKTRLAGVIYTYKKAGIDVDKYAKEIEELTGVKPYGIEKEINPGGIKGFNGVQEILEQTLGEERALAIMSKIQDVLQRASPHKEDSIFELLDNEKQLYAVANPRKQIIARARRDNGRMVYKETVVNGYPKTVEVYVNPIGGITKFHVIWEVPTRPKPIDIGPTTVEDIVDRLRAEGLVRHRNLAYDVVSTVLDGYIKKGKAIFKTEIESPGFYEIEGKITPVRVEIKKPGMEELKKALELLNELAEKWFSHVKDKFSMIIKWGIISPFSYIYKQRGAWIRWLYLYGASGTGKTTLGEVVLSLWGLGSNNIKSGANIDSPARLGYVLSQNTYPVVINEPGNAINRDDIIEMVKSAVESTVVRGKYVHGSYTEIPSLAPLIFASNKVLPRDDALMRRLLVLQFTYGERIPPEKAKEFETTIKPRLKELRAIGDYVAYLVINNKDILTEDWEKTAISLLESVYKEVGLETPGWLYEKYESEENIYDDIKERIRESLLNAFIEKYTTRVAKLTNEDDLEVIVQRVLTSYLIPWAYLVLRDGYNEVRFTAGLIDELKPRVGDISLKSLAELLGWEYKVTKVNGRSVKTVVVKLRDLINFLEVT